MENYLEEMSQAFDARSTLLRTKLKTDLSVPCSLPCRGHDRRLGVENGLQNEENWKYWLGRIVWTNSNSVEGKTFLYKSEIVSAVRLCLKNYNWLGFDAAISISCLLVTMLIVHVKSKASVRSTKPLSQRLKTLVALV